MGLFKPYERAKDAAASAPEPEAIADPKAAKKSVPTPTRAQAEQQRRERLHPTVTKKESRARERQARDSQREESMRRMDSQPGKVLIRDYVDARRSISGWSMPIIMGTLLLSLVGSSVAPAAITSITLFTYAVMALIVVDVFVMWRGYRKLHAQRLPSEPLKGLMAYGINRAINLRRLRSPSPRVNLGDKV